MSCPLPTATSSLRFFLFSSERLLGEALRHVVRQEEGISLVGFCTRWEELLRQLEKVSPDALLVQISGVRKRNDRWVAALRRRFPDLQLVVMGLPEEDPDRVLELVEAGASGFVFRKAHPRELVEVIRQVCRRRPPCPPALAGRLLERLAELCPEDFFEDGEFSLLTRRERTVLNLMVRGLRNKEIAARLDLSVSTVKNHTHRILRKLKVPNRRAAVQRYLESSLEGVG